jgi:tRNA (guanine10-N2)-dimethyltransferase
MKVFFQLYRRYADIAAAEAFVVTNGKRIALISDEILIADISHAAFSRLGLVHAAYEFLFVCNARQLERAIARTNFQKHYRTSFKVTTHHTTPAAGQRTAQLVAARLRNGKADMRNPRSWFHFFFLKSKVVAGKMLWANTEDFESRKVHRWPAPHPTGTHPQLARAMVNLTGIERGELVDPFCGAGGTLIEAGLMGLKPVGSDIEPTVLAKAVKNLEGYGIKNYKLMRKDARTLSEPVNHLVADLPYGRNTPKIGLEELYLEFLQRLKKILKGRAVLGFPNTIPHKPLLKKAKLKLLDEFDWYINRKLSKKIVVVENPLKRWYENSLR